MPAARPATGARPALVLHRPPPIRLASADSSGGLGIVELDGELTLITPGAASTLRAGEAALAPRGIPHAYRVESERARFLVVYTPGGFADFGAAASVPAGFADLPPADRVLYQPALLAAAKRERRRHPLPASRPGRGGGTLPARSRHASVADRALS